MVEGVGGWWLMIERVAPWSGGGLRQAREGTESRHHLGFIRSGSSGTVEPEQGQEVKLDPIGASLFSPGRASFGFS